MKKLLISAFALVSIALGAQTTATLSVKLNPIMSITVNQPSVTTEFTTEQDYVDGKDLAIPDHLTTFSTGGYQVSARALSPTIQGPTDDLDLDIVTITANSNFPQAVYTPVVLSETATQLFNSPVGAGRKRHNVNYNITGDLWDKAMETYSVSVMYEITAN